MISCDKTKAALREFVGIREKASQKEKALFLNRFGNRLSIFAVEKLFERVRKAAGIRRRVTPQALRHTLGTMLIKNGESLKTVCEILGHSSRRTAKAYEEIAPRRQQKVFGILNKEKRLGVRVVRPLGEKG